MPENSSGEVDPEREVRRLHLMLEDWYGGVRPDIDPIEDALASDFTAILADGRLRDRAESVQAWHDEHATYRSSSPPVRLELENLRVQRTIYGVHQVTFKKRIFVEGEWNAFNCSLWLRETSRVRTGLQWLHLQETPIPPESDGDEDAESHHS